jgi:hypothetical protein
MMAMIVLTAGCGSDDRTALEPRAPGEFPLSAEVVPDAVARGATPSELVLTFDLPVADGTDRCRSEVQVDPFADEVQVTLSMQLLIWQPDPSFPGCAREKHEVTVTLDADLGTRAVSYAPSQRWIVSETGALVRCRLPACDPAATIELPARCDNSSLRDAAMKQDVPAHSRIVQQRCDNGWALVDVDVGAGACGAVEGPNPCAGKRIDRHFFRVDGSSWTWLGVTRDAGCDFALGLDPGFPTALCADLAEP